MVEFKCSYCGLSTKYKGSLQRHIKSHLLSKARPAKRRHNCPVCKTFWCNERREMINHYVSVHSARLENRILDFKNGDEFMKWKEDLEKKEMSRYVKPRAPRKNNSYTSVTYHCHREGFFVSKGKDMRHMKVLGSNKINSCCPAEINVKFYWSGAVQVKFVCGHFGHDMELGRIQLSRAQRLMIASKLANKVPFDAVLDSIRESMYNGECERVHLATRKDLHNVVRDLNLRSKIVKHSTSASSVQSWVNEMSTTSNLILFYKAQKKTHTELEYDDFVLIISNEVQLDVIKKFGNSCVCFDSTHKLTQNDFELTTMLVVDELDQGFPVAFMVSNRFDSEVMTLFINVLKEAIGCGIFTSAFMADMSDIYYDAWCNVMPRPSQRFFCSWHVHQAWRKNLKKISDPVKKAGIYKMLCSLVEETDETDFIRLFEATVQEMKNDEGTRNFAVYFQNEYAKSAKYWAYCYRNDLSVNTNMHLESMYNYIKNLYFQGKRNKRLDWVLNSLMKFIRDKMFGRLMSHDESFAPLTLENIRKCHKKSQLMTDVQIQKIDEGWSVLSKKGLELYSVTPTNDNCSCPLRCDICDSCIHDFKCTCPDSVAKWHMCKHIHLIATHFKSHSQPSPSNKQVAKVSQLIVPINDDINRRPAEQASVEFVEWKKQENNDMESRLLNVKSQFDEIVSTIKTPSQLSILENRVANIISALKFAESAKLTIPLPIKTIYARQIVIPNKKFHKLQNYKN